MTPADLEDADRLRAQARWNQTLDDWRRLLAYGADGCFVATLGGKIVGSATTTRYGIEVAWIGMVLVDEAHRRRGIGADLMRRCLKALSDVRSVQLDATPLGQPLYEKLDFRSLWTWHRWERPELESAGEENRAGITAAVPCRNWQVSDLDRMVELDSTAFGAPRAIMVQRLARDSRATLVAEDDSGKAGAFGMLRKGSRADYIGPVVAESPEMAECILNALRLAGGSRGIFWDIPDANRRAVELAEAHGFTRQRPLVRMARGTAPVIGDQARYFAIADPGIG